MKNGKMEGYGIYEYADGDIYEAEFKNDCKDGYGLLFLSNGRYI